MKKTFSVVAIIFLTLMLTSCSEEQQNKLSRLGVTWLEGDYKITYADGEHVKEWIVEDGKVTSEAAKGYYYFWATIDGKKSYVQTPIARTYIEEIKP
jgi:major membrane immunogen (membrane-anchored lipoprotein)